MRIKTLSILFLAASMLVIGIEVNAQSYSIKDRMNWKVAYSSYPILGIHFSGRTFTPTFQTEVNYGVLNFLEVGAYTGYCSIKTSPKTSDPGFISSIDANTFFYGLNANVHLLPFLLKTEKFRIDLYASGKCGGFYRASAENMWPERGHTLDYGLYAGTAFYLGEHFGLFGEYGLGNTTNHRFGLSFKF
jgi:hypothetical protein